jgi:hypothetical protein
VKVTAECSRDGRFWFIHVPQVDGYTQAASLDDVVDMTADLVSMKTGLPASQVQVEVHVEPVSA